VRITIYVDEREYLFEGSYHTYFQYHSCVEVCPTCLRLWAKIHVESTSWFYAESLPCENCPWPWQNRGTTGSLLHLDAARGPVQLLDILPRPLVEREFRVHMKSHGVILNDSPKFDALKAAIESRSRRAPTGLWPTALDP
jgi:hypothetical protein